MAKTKYVFFNGEIVPHDEAKVHVGTTAFKFGAAVFEGVRGYWNAQHEQIYLFRMPEHMQRLLYSQRVMRFDEILEADYVTEKTIELIRANVIVEHCVGRHHRCVLEAQRVGLEFLVGAQSGAVHRLRERDVR